MSPCYSDEYDSNMTESLMDLSFDELLNVKIITASRYEQNIKDAPGIVSVLKANEIELFGANNLFEILNRLPSVISFIGHSIDSVVIRGGDLYPFTDKVAFLLDGYPIRNVGGNGTVYNFLYSFPLSRIKQIEVVRGPGSVIYGTDAFDGVINIITKDGSEKQTAINFSLGEFDTGIIELNTGNKLDDFRCQLGLNYSETNTAGLYSQQSENSLADSFKMYFPEKNLSINSKLSYKNTTINLHSSSADKYVNFTTDSFLAPIYTQLKDDILQLNYRSDVTLISIDNLTNINDSIQWKNSFSYNNEHFQWLLNDDLLIKAEGTNYYVDSLLSVDINEKYFLITGINYRNITSEPNPNIINGYDFNYVAIYGELKYSFSSKLLLYLGLQYNKPIGYNEAVVPRFALSYELNNDMNLKYSIGKAFKSPNPNQYLVDNRVPLSNGDVIYLDKGNPDLNAEIVITNDIQLTYEKNGISLSLSGYASKATDLIISKPQDFEIDGNTVTYQYARVNEGYLKSYGLEFEGKFKLTDNVYATSSFVMNQNKLNGKDENYNMTPNYQLKLGMSYSDSSYRVSSFLIASDKYQKLEGLRNQPENITFINPDPNDYYDLSANIKIYLHKLFPNSGLPNTSLSLYARNLLNYRQWQPDAISHRIQSLPGMHGRNFNLQLRIEY